MGLGGRREPGMKPAGQRCFYFSVFRRFIVPSLKATLIARNRRGITGAKEANLINSPFYVLRVL